jgi:hypothetical protein
MSHQDLLYTWGETISTHLPSLRGPQAELLAEWSFATATVGTCGRTTVAAFLAAWFGVPDRTVDQRLREWYCDAAAKAGDHRQTLAVQTCFPELLRWLLTLWSANEKRLAFALDATTLGQRFTVLALCLLYRDTAIPVAWAILPAAQPGAWKPHWQTLLRAMVDVVPADWTVLVLADRGLYAPWLFRTIRRVGWHPFLRINPGGYYRRVGQRNWQPLQDVVAADGQPWAGAVFCHKTRSLRATLVARHDAGHADPWLILTDLSPEQAEAGWYALRMWIECSFKTTKSGAWQWQRTRMEQPDRASRLWLVLAVATLFTVTLGSAAEDATPVSALEQLPAGHIARRRATGRPRRRALSLVRRGRIVLLVAGYRGQALPIGSLSPGPWSETLSTSPPKLET